MEIILGFFTILIAIATIVPLLGYEHWAIRFFDFPYVQFTCINLILIIAWSFFLGNNTYIILILLVGSLIYRLWIIFPYTRFARLKVPRAEKTKNHPSLKIISANVLMTNDDYQGLIDIVQVEKPDLVLLVEADVKWQKAVKEEFDPLFPYQLLEPLDNTYGLLLYSRFALSDTEIRYLIEEDVPSFHAIIQLDNGSKIRFFGVHPKPPSPSENSTSLERDAELILVGREAKRSELPVIIAGDLNDVAWSHTTRLFIRISELLDPRMGRGFFNTFHAHYPVLRWPLDHMFLSPHFQVEHISRLDNFHSDHFPMCMSVILNPSSLAFEQIETSEKEDRLEAKDKVSRVNDI